MRIMVDLEQPENEMPLYIPPPPPRKPIIKREIDISTRVRRKLNFNYYENAEVEIKSRKRLKRTYENEPRQSQAPVFSGVGEILLHNKEFVESSSRIREFFFQNQGLVESSAIGERLLHNQGFVESFSKIKEVSLNGRGIVECSKLPTPVKSDKSNNSAEMFNNHQTLTVSPLVGNHNTNIPSFIAGDSNEEHTEVLTVEGSTYITPEKTTNDNIGENNTVEETNVSLLSDSSELDTSFSSESSCSGDQ